MELLERRVHPYLAFRPRTDRDTLVIADVPIYEIPQDQILRIIDHLQKTGLLERGRLALEKQPSRPKEVHYTLQIKGLGPIHFALGDSLLKQLRGLREILDGDAAKGVDRFIQKLVDADLGMMMNEISKWSAGELKALKPLKAIHDQSAATRYHAICKLDANSSKEHEEALLGALQDEVRWLRYAAAVRLADANRHPDKIAPYSCGGSRLRLTIFLLV